MSEQEDEEAQVGTPLSQGEELSREKLEDEIMKMLACLHPLPIKIERVKGVHYPEGHGFMIVDEKSREEYGLEGKDTVYRWDVGNEQCNGLDMLFTVALYGSLNYRTEKLLEAQAREWSDGRLRSEERERLRKEVQGMHKVSIKLFDGARVERVIRRKSIIMYKERIIHIIAFFTLHGKKHRAWYTLTDGWHEIPVDVPLNTLQNEHGTIDL
ncbi:MAG: hypothetical protein JO202_07105 [Ktedonobacteraceae bacterium]|nr:hypothetical protein [Ktedonobacteraceae bacterium]